MSLMNWRLKAKAFARSASGALGGGLPSGADSECGHKTIATKAINTWTVGRYCVKSVGETGGEVVSGERGL